MLFEDIDQPAVQGIASARIHPLAGGQIVTEMETTRFCRHPDLLGDRVRADDDLAAVGALHFENPALHLEINVRIIRRRFDGRFDTRQFLLTTFGKFFFVHGHARYRESTKVNSSLSRSWRHLARDNIGA